MLNNNTLQPLLLKVWKGSSSKALIVLAGPDQPQLGLHPQPFPRSCTEPYPIFFCWRLNWLETWVAFAITIFIFKACHHAQPLFHLWVAFLRHVQIFVKLFIIIFLACLVFHHFISFYLLFRVGSASAASKGQIFYRTGKGLSNCNGFLQRSHNLENPQTTFLIYRTFSVPFQCISVEDSVF